MVDRQPGACHRRQRSCLVATADGSHCIIGRMKRRRPTLNSLPRPMSTIDIRGFDGGEHVEHTDVTCRGDPAEFRSIVERSIAFVRTYSQTLGSGDLAGAYALTSASLRERMDPARFEQLHREAESEF